MKKLLFVVMSWFIPFVFSQSFPTSQPTILPPVSSQPTVISTPAPSSDPPSSRPTVQYITTAPSIHNTSLPSTSPTAGPTSSLPTSTPSTIPPTAVPSSIILTSSPSQVPTLAPTVIAIAHSDENKDRLTGSDIAGISAICIFVMIVLSCICAGKRRRDVVEFAEDVDLEMMTTDSQPLTTTAPSELSYRRPQPYRD